MQAAYGAVHFAQVCPLVWVLKPGPLLVTITTHVPKRP